jgi:ribonuclease D
MIVIADTAALTAFCQRLSRVPYVTVDTEFMRERTFWPQLCLVQLAGPDEAAAIDPLAAGIDLQPLFELMVDPNVLKVFHAARQDVEIFHHLTGRIPTPMFDTQVAAMVCGFGDSVGYEALVSKLAKARIDKSSRFTDWSKRPLTERQVRYALSDVTHLRVAYDKLNRRLHESRRESWLKEEMAVLTDPATYDIHPEEAFRRIKGRGANPRMLAILREVTAWREMEARRRDLPRNRVVRDEALVEIAHHAPKTVEELARTRGLGRGLVEGLMGQALLQAVARGLAIPDAECPRPEAREPLPKGIGPVADLLKVLLKMKCEEADVAQRLVASADDVELIAALGEKAAVHTLVGWRREVFGEAALRLLRGELTLAVERGKVRLREAAPAEA